MARTEVVRSFPIEGNKVITVILRDSISPDDPLISLARAKALAIRTGEGYDSNRISRSIKDHLIKTNITI